jgi:DNA-binding NarL/FixJ family response regulator
MPSRTRIPIKIVGEADDGQQAVEQVQALHPDVVVLDLPTHVSVYQPSVSGSKLGGLAAIRTIKSRWPAVRIVVLTIYATDRSAFLLAGADAFLLKGCPTSDLLDAVMPAER